MKLINLLFFYFLPINSLPVRLVFEDLNWKRSLSVNCKSKCYYLKHLNIQIWIFLANSGRDYSPNFVTIHSCVEYSNSDFVLVMKRSQWQRSHFSPSYVLVFTLSWRLNVTQVPTIKITITFEFYSQKYSNITIMCRKFWISLWRRKYFII